MPAFIWSKRAQWFAREQRQLDAIPVPEPRDRRPDNSKPKRKDHRYAT